MEEGVTALMYSFGICEDPETGRFCGVITCPHGKQLVGPPFDTEQEAVESTQRKLKQIVAEYGDRVRSIQLIPTDGKVQ